MNRSVTKTVDLLSKIQEIVQESGVTEEELQKSGQEIRKQLVNKYYQKNKIKILTPAKFLKQIDK